MPQYSLSGRELTGSGKNDKKCQANGTNPNKLTEVKEILDGTFGAIRKLEELGGTKANLRGTRVPEMSVAAGSPHALEFLWWARPLAACYMG